MTLPISADTATGWIYAPQGLQARLDLPLAWALLAGAAVLATAVIALALRAAVAPPRPVRARAWLWGGGIALPVLLLSALAVANLTQIARDQAPPPPDALLTGVTARPWWWQLRVADPDGGPGIVTANELVLPVGRPVRLALGTASLIHSLWVPALAGKVDLIPGRVNHLVLQADRPGRWRGPCAEFCGEGHTQMVLHVVALAPADYAAWQRNQALPAREPANPLQAAGRRRFVDLGCGNCHTVRGVVEAAPLAAVAAGDAGADFGGPDLTHLATRRWLGAGTLVNDAAGLRAWITGVQRLKPGARMPQYDRLDAATLDALVAWLGSLE